MQAAQSDMQAAQEREAELQAQLAKLQRKRSDGEAEVG